MALLAVDLETTGLDQFNGSILEIAARILDKDLNVVDRFDGILGIGDVELSQMDDYVTKMHTDNGLMYEAATCDLADFVQWAQKHGELMLLGNSVTFDRDWLQHHCPELDISYRVIDISSFKRLLEHAGSPTMVVESNHRAASDIDACINHAKYFLKKLR